MPGVDGRSLWVRFLILLGGDSMVHQLPFTHSSDTRAVLCSTETGKAFPMTENHHADTREEATRLRRIGTGLVTDSFGEARWMGAVANTRGYVILSLLLQLNAQRVKKSKIIG